MVIVLIATVLWSTAGLFVRMAALDTWSVVAWRSLAAFVALGLFWLVAKREKTTGLRATWSLPGVAAVFISVVSGICYVVSLEMTTVANVMTVYAALPFIASAIAFFALRERVTARFVVCGLAASVGVAVMASAAVTFDDMAGIAAALLMTAGFAASLVLAKRFPVIDMTVVTAVAAAISFAIALPLMAVAVPTPPQLLACALLGALTTGLANVMSLAGGRLIRSGEAGLLSLPDIALGPLWVWWVFDERVSTHAFVGGTIVLLAVIFYLLRPGKPQARTVSA